VSKPLALAASIGGLAAVASPISSADDNDKYAQTWGTPYGKTTCGQFLSEMTGKQQWVMAADMLTNARNLHQKTGLPSDAMITEFEGGLETACVISSMTMTMADAGTALYLSEPRFQP
jgi:hypothetical protein